MGRLKAGVLYLYIFFSFLKFSTAAFLKKDTAGSGNFKQDSAALTAIQTPPVHDSCALLLARDGIIVTPRHWQTILIGGGFAKDELGLIPPFIPVGVLDAPGSFAAALVSGDFPSNPGVGRLESVLPISFDPNHFRMGYDASTEYLKRLNTPDLAKKNRILFLVFGIPEDPAIGTRLQELSDNNLIIVTGIGNGFPILKPNANQESRSVINVGNATSLGLMDPHSEEGEALSILAPTGETFTLLNRGASHQLKGSTIISAGITTAAITNALLIQNDLTSEEIKAMLKNTALPILAAPGLLNAYKLVLVAQQLRTRIRNNLPAEERHALIFNQNSTLYDFRQAAETYLTRAETATKTTDNLSLILDLYLRSYLLHPNKKARVALEALFKFKGEHELSLFFTLLDPRLKKDEHLRLEKFIEIWKSDIATAYIKKQLLRAATQLRIDISEITKLGLTDTDLDVFSYTRMLLNR